MYFEDVKKEKGRIEKKLSLLNAGMKGYAVWFAKTFLTVAVIFASDYFLKKLNMNFDSVSYKIIGASAYIASSIADDSSTIEAMNEAKKYYKKTGIYLYKERCPLLPIMPDVKDMIGLTFKGSLFKIAEAYATIISFCYPVWGTILAINRFHSYINNRLQARRARLENIIFEEKCKEGKP